MKQVVQEFTVSRKGWLRGEGSESSALLREEDGKKCCLGFYANACGISDDEILGAHILSYIVTPQSHPQVHPTFSDREAREGWVVAEAIMNLNDRNDMGAKNDSERERELTAKFAKLGITIHFVD